MTNIKVDIEEIRKMNDYGKIKLRELIDEVAISGTRFEPHEVLSMLAINFEQTKIIDHLIESCTNLIGGTSESIRNTVRTNTDAYNSDDLN